LILFGYLLNMNHFRNHLNRTTALHLSPIIMALGGTLFVSAPSWAICMPSVTDGATVTCTGTTTSRIGSGPAAGNDNVTVNVLSDAIISVGDDAAISLHDGAN